MSAPTGVTDPISPDLNRDGFEQGIRDGHRDGLQQCGWQDPDRVRAQQDEPSGRLHPWVRGGLREGIPGSPSRSIAGCDQVDWRRSAVAAGDASPCEMRPAASACRMRHDWVGLLCNRPIDRRELVDHRVWGEQAILPRPMYRRTAPNGRRGNSGAHG
jgi:hypothetical protein